jgi:hypothetical protein
MAKKRKASGHAEPSKSNGFEERGGKMGQITTYEDVADSEDEFHINRDKVLLGDGLDAKRRKKWQEEGRNGTASLCTLLTSPQMPSYSPRTRKFWDIHLKVKKMKSRSLPSLENSKMQPGPKKYLKKETKMLVDGAPRRRTTTTMTQSKPKPTP